MRDVKIAVVGIGSASFGPATLGDVLGKPELAGSTLVLVDVDADSLALMTSLARKLNAAWGAGLKVQATTDRRRALRGADFVVTMVEVNRDRLWQQDLTIPHKHGVMQVLGENGGPGGLAHTLRTVPLVLEVAEDMERLCPEAWLLNYSNPLPRIARAVRRYTDIRCIGFCHGVGSTVEQVAAILGLAADEVDVKVAGLNHFHWVMDVRRRGSGEDLYPQLREREPQHQPAHDYPLCRDVFRRFGWFPFPSDDHVGEYLHYMHVPQFKSWRRYKHDHWLLHWDGKGDNRAAQWARVRAMAEGQESFDHLRHGSGERAVDVLLGLRDNRNSFELALNIPNEGCIDNLPAECIVEVPAWVSGSGPTGWRAGELPLPVAALCNLQVHVAELAVEAAVTGDRHVALQALLVDPVINDIEVAEKLLDELLAASAEYLPRFSGAR